MDWGNVTPEGFNEKENEALHVFNFDLSKKENIDNAILFTLGKMLRSKEDLPEDCKQTFTFDVRGQKIPDGGLDYLVTEIEKKLTIVSQEVVNYAITFIF